MPVYQLPILKFRSSHQFQIGEILTLQEKEIHSEKIVREIHGIVVENDPEANNMFKIVLNKILD